MRGVTQIKKNSLLAGLATILVVFLTLLFFLSRSIEARYTISRITPDSLNSFVCNPSSRTREQINTTLNNLYANLGSNMNYSQWLRSEVKVCNNRIYIYETGGGFHDLSMYDLHGNIVDRCEQKHTVLGVSQDPRCYAVKGSPSWQVE